MSKEAVRTTGDIYNQIGGFGSYQKLLGLLTQLTTLLWVAVSNIFSFGTLEPAYYCEGNLTDICDVPDQCVNVSFVSQFHSFVEEWSLRCGTSYVPHFLESLQNVALMISCFFGGHLADYFGRKWMVVGSLLLASVVNFCASFATTWQMFAVFVAASGLSQGLGFSAQVVLCLELVPKRYRLLMQSCFQYTLAYGMSALIAYLVGDWRQYTMIVFGISAAIMLVYSFALVESPYWLIHKQRYDEALRSLRTIARINRVKGFYAEVGELEVFVEDDSARLKPSFIDLFRQRRFALYTVTLALSFFIMQSITTIIVYGIGTLAGNPFLNVALFGLSRVWVPVLLVWFDFKMVAFGRKITVAGSLSIVTACLAINATILLSGHGGDLHVLVTVCALFCGAVNASVYDVGLYTWVSELYPTAFRAIAQGTLDTVGLAGSIVGPQILFLRLYWLPAPYAITGVLCVTNIVMMCCLLPETKPVQEPSDREYEGDVELRN